MALQKCVFDGKVINLNNGNETRDLTGRAVVTDVDTGKVVREITFDHGKEVAAKFHYDDGSVAELQYNSKGNKHGRCVEYHPDGKMREEGEYRDGSNVGWRRKWAPGGGLIFEEFYQELPGQVPVPTFKRGFNLIGQLSQLRCGTSDPPPEFAEVCGFVAGPRHVVLYGSDGKAYEERTVSKGEILERKTLADGIIQSHEVLAGGVRTRTLCFADGKPRLSYQARVADRRRHGREQAFGEGGGCLFDRSWKDGTLVSVKAYFMNGRLQLDATRRDGSPEGSPESSPEGSPKGCKEDFDFKSYYDTGELFEEGALKFHRSFAAPFADHVTFRPEFCSYDYEGALKGFHQNGAIRSMATYEDGKGHGKFHRFRPDGVLELEVTFEKGVMVGLRRFDEKGAVELDETYFPDGSIKAKAK